MIFFNKKIYYYNNIYNNKKGFDELTLLKVWKGLFYCFWMSDKPIIQHVYLIIFYIYIYIYLYFNIYNK